MEERHKRIQANSRENQPGIKNNPVILESSGLHFSRVQKGWPSANLNYILRLSLTGTSNCIPLFYFFKSNPERKTPGY